MSLPMPASVPFTFYLGIDVAKAKVDVALISADGKPKPQVFANTAEGFDQLLAWLRLNLAPLEQIHAGLEATNVYSDALARFLHERGAKVTIINPSVASAHANILRSRNKTDKADAKGIACYLKAYQPEAWTPPAPEIVYLQGLARRREAILNMRTMELNRLDSCLAAGSGIDPSDSTGQTKVRESIEAVIALFNEQIKALEKEMNNHIGRTSSLKEKKKLLETIPGIGEVTAFVLLAEIPDISRYDGAPALACYAGLTPRQMQSGSSVRGRTKLSKVGSARLRKALFFPAMTALRKNPFIVALKERMLARGKCMMSVIGAAMRKLLHIVFGVLKSGKPFDPLHGVKETLLPT